MTPLSTSLRCLKHPVTVASVVVLLLNDHLFKAAFPSWVTGKLSDFAGLFFFPFLLAALLAMFLKERRARYAGVLAFVVTAIWFALIKLSPDANRLMESGLSWLLGYPTRIVLDPTDLIALVVLWPAWRLWQQQTQQPPLSFRATRFSYAMLGVAALATVATSPPMDRPISSIAVGEDGTIYAASATGDVEHPPYIIYESKDGGYSWEYKVNEYWGSLNMSPIVAEDLAVGDELPSVQCLSPTSPRCYRITGIMQVEQSHDGGRSWTSAWTLPPRVEYIKRGELFAGSGMCFAYDGVPDGIVTPQDMEILPEGEGHRIVVALGENGVLVRHPNGTWSRVGVGGCARPAPYSASNAQEAAFNTLWELLLLTATILFAFRWLSVGTYWQRVLVRAFIVTLMLISGWTLFVVAGPYAASTDDFFLSLSVWPWITAGVLLVMAVRLRGYFRQHNVYPGWKQGLALLILGYVPFVLWAFWIIPWYWVALVLSVLGLVSGAHWSVHGWHGPRLALSNRRNASVGG